MNELREKPAPLDPLRTDTGGELSSAYLCMTNQINLVASAQGLATKIPSSAHPNGPPNEQTEQ